MIGSWRYALPVVLAGAVLAPGSLPAQRLECDRCHAELELLRQQVSSLAEAERLLVPAQVVAGSAHGRLPCTECHSGVGRYPHAETVLTRSCASCHAAADSVWRGSVHANVRDREPIGCSACHGLHDVASREQLKTAAAIDIANARCSSCHEGQQLPPSDAHAGRALCAACHGGHDVQGPELAASRAHPLRQLETCGACHDSIASVWRRDVHADTLRRVLAAGGLDADPATLPGCTACHDSHGMIRPNAPGFAGAEVARCQVCHEQRTATYLKSYHGKAESLGSEVAASCARCHGGHGIRPSADPASMVHPDNLLETCRTCHPQARPAFVRYDSHPEPLNPTRNPWITASFIFMNGLLIFVILVFGAHTVLWWIRLAIDRRRGTDHDHHGGHGEGGVA